MSFAGGLTAVIMISLSTLSATIDRADAQPELAGAPTPPSASDCPANTPSALAPPADTTLKFALDAQGVQRYQCVQSTAGFAWMFVAPDADLFPLRNANGLLIHHFGGPTWLYKDASSVVAARVSGATIDPAAIPWLLLEVTSHGGPRGQLTDVEYIQRLSTTGGNAPSSGCDADHVGTEATVLYTARYAFYNQAKMPTRIRCGG